ncbi:MAG: PTS-dependent dihydroxyacetone kinase phosphotransferase subunit DhaM [Thermaerobacter sp.]|nr:PTS-dependent dihydroxyacetone kinase phosphotransferase subunit DhaM [Thermaerobacter sp.]
MVGLVIVSHSAQIALGVKELAGQMADRGLKIVEAGGMPDGSLGTDTLRIHEAIVEADSGQGVVVLVDLGSAVLSAKTALELLEPSTARRAQIADAPLVEGSISAAVEASIGGSLAEVVAAAEAARGILKL